jgi:microcin C transport system substrate-binding protein
MEPPLTSGPYRIADFEQGRYVVRERVEDYWGADLPVNVGRNNFDRRRTEYFRDATIIRTALKAGTLDFREENQAKAWALAYDIPAVEQGWLRKEEIRHNEPTGMQAFVMNTRRPVFRDPKVRRALAFAFDFEWTNEALFFGQYARTESYFSNSELASRGLPEGEELEILSRFRDDLPEEVFTTPYWAPGTDGSGWPRDNLITALEMLNEAGWVVRDMQLVDRETGEPMRFEILLVSPAFERIVLPFVRNLSRLGIEASVRLVDRSQYVSRLRSFDFDMIVGGWGQSDSPGNEQRGYWTSESADQPRSRNFAGLADPVVDELVRLLIVSPDRESLVQRTRALDRVLLWKHLVIPQWHIQTDRVLWWDKFARPDTASIAKDGVSIDRWWYVPAKAQALAARERTDPALTAGGASATDGGATGGGATGGGATEGGGTPGWGTTLLVTAGLAILAFFVFRGALRRRTA